MEEFLIEEIYEDKFGLLWNYRYQLVAIMCIFPILNLLVGINGIILWIKLKLNEDYREELKEKFKDLRNPF